MNTAQAYQAYRQNQVQNLPREKLVIMLCEGAVRFLNLALQGIRDREPEQIHRNLLKTQDIILEFRSTLNREAGEIAEDLDALYAYMHRRLVEANVQKEPGPVEEVKAMLEELRDVWKEAVKKAR